MNYAIVIFILGWIIRVEGAFLMLPFVVSLIYREPNGVYFLGCAVGAFLLGTLLTLKKPGRQTFYAREGFVTTALGWIVMSLIGGLPFWLSREIPSYVDCFFEIVSGFTTTGSSILPDVEALSKCMLFWRSFSHWLGGMGVLVFVLAILPMAGGESVYFMKAESPGPSVSKMVPKLKNTAAILYEIYVVMLFILIGLLLLAGMPAFDAVCMAMGTAGTGGFSILRDGCASYSTLQQLLLTIGMMLFGTNFSFFFLLLIRKPKDAFSMEEVRWYYIIFAAASLFIAADLTVRQGGNPLMNLHHAAFQVSTIMTTTGYSTTDFNLWPEFSRAILVVLMLIGACAGSTGGGIKVSRILIYFKSWRKEMEYLIHPRSVKVVKMDGKRIPDSVLRSSFVFLATYFVIMFVSLLLISLDNFDFTTNFTAIASTLNNIGPGLGVVGPLGNFGGYSDFSKLVMSFDMLAGRLELFPMLLLFAPSTWKKLG